MGGTPIPQPIFYLSLEKPGDAEALRDVAEQAAADHLTRVGGAVALARAITRAEQEVREIVVAKAQLERFHGKTLLHRLYEDHVKNAGWSYATFAYTLAREVVGTERLNNLIGIPVRKIQQFVPATLLMHLDEARTKVDEVDTQGMVTEAYEAAAQARAVWEQGGEDVQDREDLRRKIQAVLHILREHSQNKLRQQLLSDLVQLGGS